MMKAMFVCGRLNPPTKGHDKLVDLILNFSIGSGLLFITKGCDSMRNPLGVEEKLSFIQEIYPGLIVEPTRDPFTALDTLCERDYTDITYVCGEDREDMILALRRYGESKGVMVRGIVVPRTSEDVSSTMARDRASKGDWIGFSDLVCGSEETKRKMYSAVRRGLLGVE